MGRLPAQRRRADRQRHRVRDPRHRRWRRAGRDVVLSDQHVPRRDGRRSEPPFRPTTGASPGRAAAPSDPGTRIISGLPTAALLRLSDGSRTFAYQTTSGDIPGALGGGGTFGPGGETLSQSASHVEGGAAFLSPTEGWLGSALTAPSETPEVIHLTAVTGRERAHPVAGPVPAPAAGLGPGARHHARSGERPGDRRRCPWRDRPLHAGPGLVAGVPLRRRRRQCRRRRCAEWPGPRRAASTPSATTARCGCGAPRPACGNRIPAKPFNFHGNLTAIAFAPGNPDLGYAVGKQGVLLAYDKTWTQQTVPAAVSQAHFTSVAFAGSEAIVAYRMLDPANPSQEEGGLLVNNGLGVAASTPRPQSLLSTLPAGQTRDHQGRRTARRRRGRRRSRGGARARLGHLPVAVSSAPLADSDNGNIAALAAIRDGARCARWCRSMTTPRATPAAQDNLLWQEIDNPPATAAGEPPLLVGPDPLPSHGFLVRETASGWVDEQLADYPNQLSYGATDGDLPGWPDPVLALLVDPAGDQGWAVGGQTGGDELQLNGADGAAGVVQTAGIERFGGGVVAAGERQRADLDPGRAGDLRAWAAARAARRPCSDNASQNLGPDAWLTGAIGRASQIGGLRALPVRRAAARRRAPTGSAPTSTTASCPTTPACSRAAARCPSMPPPTAQDVSAGRRRGGRLRLAARRACARGLGPTGVPGAPGRHRRLRVRFRRGRRHRPGDRARLLGGNAVGRTAAPSSAGSPPNSIPPRRPGFRRLSWGPTTSPTPAFPTRRRTQRR